MANSTFGTNILPKNNTVTIGNSTASWTIVSPTLTGTPTAPTAATGTDTTQIATTAFVQDAIDGLTSHVFFTTLGFSIATTDWSSTAPYEYTFTNALIGDNTTVDVYPDFYSAGQAYALPTWKKALNSTAPDMKWEKVSGGVKFTVATIPSDTITGTIRVMGDSSNNNYVEFQETTLPITKGGTGAANVAGAKSNLGLNNVENKSSATIRSEITSANVTVALGFTPKSTQTAVSDPTASGYDISFIDSISQNANGEITATKKSILFGTGANQVAEGSHTHTGVYAPASHTHSEYAPKASPVFTGSISLGRKSGTTVGGNSIAIGSNVEASGSRTFALGNASKASGADSSAFGYSTTASGDCSHAEGYQTTASNSEAHAEGISTTASAYAAHAEGGTTTASGEYSHAEGLSSTASGSPASHAEGRYTIANHSSQHAFGEYNVSDPSSNTKFNRGTYIEIVGNGTSNNSRSNARALDWNGNQYLKGTLYVNCGADSTGGTAVLARGCTWGQIKGV